MFTNKLIAFANVLVVLALATPTQAQQTTPTTASPRVLPYHGVLSNGHQGIVKTADVTIAIYSDPVGTFMVWEDRYQVTIHDGTFETSLGSGKNPLPENSVFAQPLWVRVECNGTIICSLCKLNVPDSFKNLQRADATEKATDLHLISGLGLNLR